ncbi:MAG: DUF2339 domain-containing protein [Paenibacillaceae bacterium]
MDLDLRVDALEKKVKDLEQQLYLLRPLEKEQPQVHQMQSTNTSSEHRGPIAQQLHTNENKQAEELPPIVPTDWEHLIARVWLPRIFIVVFLLGVLWGFTAAVNAGFITEPVRCILGILAAGFMYWQGEVQVRRSRSALGQVLLGGAMGVLILSLFAAHMLFDLIPSGLAFFLFIVSIGVSVYTALRHRSQALMIITLFAGYLVPFLVDAANPNIWLFAGYEALFSLAMILLSLHYSFRGAYFVAFGVLHLPLLAGLINGDVTDSRNPILLAVFLQHILLYALTTFRSKETRIDHPISLYMSFGLMVAWMYGLYGSSSDRLIYEWMIALWSVFYSVTAFWLYSQKKAFTVHLPIATLGWFLWLVYVLHFEQASAAILAEGAIALGLGIKLKSKLQQITGIAAFIIGLIGVFLHPIMEIFSTETFAWLVLLVSIGSLYMFSNHSLEESKGKTEFKLLLLWSEAILFLVFITQATNVLTRSLTFDYQHLILSAIWVIYAILVIFTGMIIKKQKVRLSGILFLFVTLLKIVFVDLPDVSTAIRAILFIGLGAIGVAISRLFYKRKG